MMNVQELEDKVWEQDGVRIVIRAAAATNVVKPYDLKNAAQASWRVTEFIEKRIKPCVGTLEVIAIEGNGEEPHGRTLLNSLRKSYK